MRIQRTIAAARCAVADRILITKGAKGKVDPEQLNYYKLLEAVSGPSVHHPAAVVKSWYKAYLHNVERIKNAEAIMNMGKPEPLFIRIIKELF